MSKISKNIEREQQQTKTQAGIFEISVVTSSLMPFPLYSPPLVPPRLQLQQPPPNGTNLNVDAHAHGFPQAQVGEGVHRGVEGGRKQQGLPPDGAHFHQLFHFILEPQLEQPVHFI